MTIDRRTGRSALTVHVHDASAGPLDPAPDVVAVPAIAGPGGPTLVAGTEALADAIGVPVPAQLPERWRERTGFQGRPGQRAILRAGEGTDVVVLGLGEEATLDSERLRRAAASAPGLARGGRLVVVLPATAGSGAGGTVPAVSAVVEGAQLAAYRFDDFRSHVDAPPATELVVVVDPTEVDEARAGAERGAVLAGATARARDLVNTPPSVLTPRTMAEEVSAMLEGLPGVSLETWDVERVTAERLGGLLGVSRGSIEPPFLLRATYTPGSAGPDVPHVVLVGKGITFDSGGLSLKTPDGMTTMKTDMGGAAAVMAALAACPALDVPVNVTALAPLTENMPSGSAIKPGDVLTIRNGATIEVLNTDAEGRLVLADALSLAVELAPDVIIDLATLTGAAVVALGRSIAAIFGTDDALVAQLRRAGELAGEPSWPLPLPDEYADHIDSDVADMKNIGRPGQAGSIAAALLLRRFVGDVPWAHLDIAGPSRSAEHAGYLSKGGTGFGVRTLLEYLTNQ